MNKQLQFSFESNEIVDYERINSLNNWCKNNNRFDLLEEWDYEKNKKYTPKTITCGSDIKVWWKCKKCGNSWDATPAHRKDGRGCPICADKERRENHHKTILRKNGNLLSVNPAIAEEWCYELNGDLRPEDVSPSSGIYVFWKCKKCGHIWKAAVTNRSSKSNKTGCPKCSPIYQSSVAEKFISFYLKRIVDDVKENYKPKFLNGKELDIYIPSFKLAIEFDGAPWHKNIEKDLLKDKLCFENGVYLIRIRDVECPKLESTSHIIICEKIRSNYRSLEEPIKQIIDILHNKYHTEKNVIVDIEKDYDFVVGLASDKMVERSVANSPLLEEWDYEKNTIKPEFITISSNKKVYWKCKTCGGSWPAKPNLRTVGTGCPYCGHRKLLKGYNDLAHVYPELAKEWDYDLNNGLKPDEIFSRSTKKYWWKCDKCGNSWSVSPGSRVKNKTKTGCPYCQNRKVKTGLNDLATTHTYLLSEWDYEANVVKSTEIVAGYNKKVHWICKVCGNKWMISPNARAYRGSGCDKCSRRQLGVRNATPEPGKSFADVFPELLLEWNYKENGDPHNFTNKSNQKVSWICEEGHTYIRSINSKVKSRKCPICFPAKKKLFA